MPSTHRARSVFGCLIVLGCLGASLLPACKRTSARWLPGQSQVSPSPPVPLRTVGAACPDDMARVTIDAVDVCVDRWEASVDGARFSEPIGSADAGARLRATSRPGVMPKVNVSAVEAGELCASAGKRLCTAAEWTAACRGAENTTYPYGEEHVEGACNEDRQSPIAALGATKLDDPRLAEAPRTIAKTGEFARCVTPSGIHDMHGNVHEWVSDARAEDPRYGVFYGGFYADTKANGPGCTYKTTAHLRTYHDYSTGFRCCVKPRT